MPRVKELVGAVLEKLNVGPEALFSTLGRVAARGIETQVLAEKMDDWVDALAANMASGELRIHDNSKWDPELLAGRCDGRRLSRGAARRAGPLGAHPRTALIANYQCVVPSTWNAGPRDAKGRRGPYEEALLGTPVADPAAADRDPAHGALVRSLHGVRRPRRRRASGARSRG